MKESLKFCIKKQTEKNNQPNKKHSSFIWVLTQKWQDYFDWLNTSTCCTEKVALSPSLKIVKTLLDVVQGVRWVSRGLGLDSLQGCFPVIATL